MARSDAAGHPNCSLRAPFGPGLTIRRSRRATRIDAAGRHVVQRAVEQRHAERGLVSRQGERRRELQHVGVDPDIVEYEPEFEGAENRLRRLHLGRHRPVATGRQAPRRSPGRDRARRRSTHACLLVRCSSAMRWAPTSAALATRSSRRIVSRTAEPAAADTGLPWTVWNEKAAAWFITLSGPTAADSGRPPPRPLPNTTMSGSMPEMLVGVEAPACGRARLSPRRRPSGCRAGGTAPPHFRK